MKIKDTLPVLVLVALTATLGIAQERRGARQENVDTNRVVGTRGNNQVLVVADSVSAQQVDPALVQQIAGQIAQQVGGNPTPEAVAQVVTQIIQANPSPVVAQAAAVAATQFLASIGAPPAQQIAAIKATVQNLGQEGNTPPPVIAALIVTAAQVAPTVVERAQTVAALRQIAAETNPASVTAIDAQLLAANVITAVTVAPQQATQFQQAAQQNASQGIQTLAQALQATPAVTTVQQALTTFEQQQQQTAQDAIQSTGATNSGTISSGSQFTNPVNPVNPGPYGG
ncbi:MAG: hypothetical protein N2035_01180 [Chthoniobacterales bacterium]|nr:hypothetical protein [Chthoniobacterales bacterium]